MRRRERSHWWWLQWGVVTAIAVWLYLWLGVVFVVIPLAIALVVRAGAWSLRRRRDVQ